MPDKWYVSTPPAALFYQDQIEEHIRVRASGSNDAYLATLQAAATDYAEESTGLALMPQTITARFEEGEEIRLPRTPLVAVVSVTDANDVALTGYRIHQVGRKTTLRISQAATYPLTVIYTAGYANAASVPASIRFAILAHIGTLYENRESVSEKAKLPVPHSLADFYRSKRRFAGVG